MFNFITDNKRYYDIKIMCKVLKVSRSSYYKHLHKKPSKHEVENQMLGNEILDIYMDSKKRYGGP